MPEHVGQFACMKTMHSSGHGRRIAIAKRGAYAEAFGGGALRDLYGLARDAESAPTAVWRIKPVPAAMAARLPAAAPLSR